MWKKWKDNFLACLEMFLLFWYAFLNLFFFFFKSLFFISHFKDYKLKQFLHLVIHLIYSMSEKGLYKISKFKTLIK